MLIVIIIMIMVSNLIRTIRALLPNNQFKILSYTTLVKITVTLILSPPGGKQMNSVTDGYCDAATRTFGDQNIFEGALQIGVV
jgi:hypothetical protein